MPDIVALDLEAGAVPYARGQNVFDVGESILEHALLRIFEIRLLPVVFEFSLVTPDHRIQAEVHRSHVERCDFRLECCGRANTLFCRHRRRATGGDVHHHVGALFDHLEEWRKRLRSLVRPAVLRIARMQVHNRCPASAAPMAASAVSCAVTGRCGDIDGVWIEPVTAQVIMTLRDFAMTFHPMRRGLLIGKWTSPSILEYQP